MPIAFTDCSFRYPGLWRRRYILRNFDLHLREGRTVLLGPNGAGKTTLMSLAVSLFRPVRGSVSLAGLDSASPVDRGAYRRKVGWLPQSIRPVPGLKVREQVAYAGWLKGLTRGESWLRAADALRQVEMTELENEPTTRLSGGQLRRVGVAQALVHDAEVMLLDEPTAGLDPLQAARVRRIIADIGTRRAVVVSTHQTEEISSVYDHVIVMDAGQVRFHGSVTDFLAVGAEPDSAGTPDRGRADAAYARLVATER